ncbi:transcriptional regulator, TetR family [Anaerovirgula multivorans]|uniref:Transcriptional regulator, TetR family n=1 Tax=Anaerovirgula multivorans TaxID=312168 RepID=A0A239DXM6_9FIRM|nr:TetR/AcrR family transcriptional regulator [Anaerovirgula multivorans]SNS36394.1 transcriptional regulator, TetR family [Anaerovirgula multivorans]
MAKHFSEEDKQVIKKKLLDESKKMFEKQGIKKTSVDQIVEKAGIAKGTFYNFYSSKESLVFDLLMNIELEIHREGMNHLNKLAIAHKFPKAMEIYILKLFRYLENEPLLFILNDSRQIQEIWMKISLKEQQRSIYQDQRKIKDYINLANQMGYKLKSSTNVFEATLRSFFFIYINQNMIGVECYESLELIVKSTLQNLFDTNEI